MSTSSALAPAHTPLQLASRPFAWMLAVLLAVTTVALGTGTAVAAEPGGPAFGPATTASMYSGEYAMITDFVPVGGSNTTVRQTSGGGLGFLTIDNQGRVFGTPPSYYAGTMDFTLLAEDDTGKTDTTTFTLTVYDRPTFYSADFAEFKEDLESEFRITSFGYPDPELSVTGLPAWLTLSEVNAGHGTLTGTPPVGSSGTYPVTVTSAIPGGPSTVQNLTLEVSRRTFIPGPYADLGGNPQVGSPLTVTHGYNSPDETSATYEWFRNDESIEGATSDTYTPNAGDLDQDIHAVVTVHRAAYDDSSDATEAVTISQGFMEWTEYPGVDGADDGDDRVGDTVTAIHGTLNPEADSYTYQWFRTSTEGTDAIDDATNADYTLTPADADAGYLTVGVTAHKAGYLDASSTGMVSVRDADFTTQPTLTLTGDFAVDSTITAETTDADPAPDSTELTWFRDGEEFTNNSNSYTFVPSDYGLVFKVRYTNYKDGYVPVTVGQSEWVELGHFADLDVSITGDGSVGGELVANVAPTTPVADEVRYQWFRDGTEIDGAILGTYTPVEDDAGTYLSVEVVATKAGYWDEDGWDSLDDVVTGGTFSVAPVVHIGGAAEVGSELFAVVEPTTPEASGLTYQWLRDGDPIQGANDETYMPVPADEGARLSVSVTASAAGYDDATATSDVTVPVIPSSTPEPPAPAKTFKVTLSARTPERGQVEVVRGSGLLAGEAYTMTSGTFMVSGHASRSGTVARSFRMPRNVTLGRKVATLRGSQTNRVGRAYFTVVAAKRLTLTTASTKVRAGSLATIRVSGLASGEHVLARYRGVRLTSWTPRANAAGVYTVRFNVGRALGQRPFVVRGAHENRVGSKNLSVRS